MEQHSRTLAAIFLMAMVQLAAIVTPTMACLYCPKFPPQSPPLIATPPPVVTTPSAPPPETATPPPVVEPTPSAPPPATCPLDTLKLGACVDVLGGLVHVGLGDPVVNQCCPVLQGVLALEAAACLCTTIKASVLNLNIVLPLALELLVACGKTPPSGFTCP